MDLPINVFATNNTTANPSRNQLLHWVNQRLEANFAKIEDMCTGAGYCQLMDMLFPGEVQIQRVKFRTNLEHEYVQNFSLLQAAFTRTGVDVYMPVERLIKGRYQDNFEFMSWFFKFFNANYKGAPYDPVAARNGVYLGSAGENKVPNSSRSVKSSKSDASATGQVTPSSSRFAPRQKQPKASSANVTPSSSKSRQLQPKPPASHKSGGNLSSHTVTVRTDSCLSRPSDGEPWNREQAVKRIEKLKAYVESFNFNKECRDFYKDKLRELTSYIVDLEVRQPDVPVSEVINTITEVLYREG